MSRLPIALLAALAALNPLPAYPHAILEATDAAQNTFYKAVIEIDHGCKGAATTAIHVTVPEGFIAAKPMPKAGWTLTIDKGAYAKAYAFKGGTLAEGAKTITWQGNLPNEDYDEFVFQGFITDAVAAGSTLYFPVIQDCGTGAYSWIETPSATASNTVLAHPAPGLRIMPGTSASNAVAIIDHLRISQPWARAAAAGASTAEAYVTVENRGRSPDRLTSVTSDIADSMTIADTRLQDEGGQDATATKGLKIAPGERLELRPNAYHFVLNGLKQPIKAGDTFKATLNFQQAGSLPLDFKVENSEALNSGAIMPIEDAPDRM